MTIKRYSCFICEALETTKNECVECHNTVCEQHYINGVDPVRGIPIKGCFLCVGKLPHVAMNKFTLETHPA